MTILGALSSRHAEIVAHRMGLQKGEWTYVTLASDVKTMLPDRIILVEPESASRHELRRYRETRAALEHLALRQRIRAEVVCL